MSRLSWAQLLSNLKSVITETGARNIHMQKSTLIGFLNSYDSCHRDYKDYVHFDENGYSKNLVEDLGPDCNIILMCWAPQQLSAFHGHEGSKCFVKVLSGELVEQQVPYPSSNTSSTFSEHIIRRNQVRYIDDSIGLHKVINRSNSEPAITLHIYSPAYTKCRIFEHQETDKNSVKFNQNKRIDVTFHTVRGQLADC